MWQRFRLWVLAHTTALSAVYAVASLTVLVFEIFTGRMTLSAAGLWLPVVIGGSIAIYDIAASFYFQFQRDMIGNNWILIALYRTSSTITIVCVWLLVARSVSLIYGLTVSPSVVPWWIGVISGLAIIWLLLIPTLLRRLFEDHEGR